MQSNLEFTWEYKSTNNDQVSFLLEYERPREISQSTYGLDELQFKFKDQGLIVDEKGVMLDSDDTHKIYSVNLKPFPPEIEDKENV